MVWYQFLIKSKKMLLKGGLQEQQVT